MNDDSVLNDSAPADVSVGGILKDIVNELVYLRGVVAKVVAYVAPIDPSYVFPLKDFVSFDWGSIGASVAQVDSRGYTAVVSWSGYLWKRRSAKDNKGEAIWFNRTYTPVGDDGWVYVRLVTFRDIGGVLPINSGINLPRPKAGVKKKVSLAPKKKVVSKIETTEYDGGAASATNVDEFDIAIAQVFASSMNGNSTTAASTREIVTKTTTYDPKLNLAYIDGINAYVDERKLRLSSKSDARSAHHEAKIKGHRAFMIKKEQIKE